MITIKIMMNSMKKPIHRTEQEIGHYEYHKETPKQPQDHKKKKMSSAKCTGIAAAVALMVGVIGRSRASDERKHG